MGPLSITTSITNTLDVARQVSNVVTAFNSTYKDTPKQMFTIIPALNNLDSVLRQLRSFLFRSLIFIAYSTTLIEETSKAVKSCHDTLKELAKALVRLCGLAGSGKRIGLLGKLLWLVRHGKTIRSIMGKLQLDESILGMLLQIFKE
jgi:hypothetical protein